MTLASMQPPGATIRGEQAILYILRAKRLGKGCGLTTSKLGRADMNSFLPCVRVPRGQGYGRTPGQRPDAQEATRNGLTDWTGLRTRARAGESNGAQEAKARAMRLIWYKMRAMPVSVSD